MIQCIFCDYPRYNLSPVNRVFHPRAAEEEDFPRGGASALSPLEVRKIKNEAEKDVLFGVNVLLAFFNTLNCERVIIIINFNTRCFNNLKEVLEPVK